MNTVCMTLVAFRNLTTLFTGDFLKHWVMKRKYDHPTEFKQRYGALIGSIENEECQSKFRRYLDG